MKTASVQNRREFLKTTTIAATATSLLGAWGKATATPRKKMFISLNYQQGWYAVSSPAGAATSGGPSRVAGTAAPSFRPPPMAWVEMAQLAAKLAYGGVDMSLEPALQDGVEKTRALYSGLNLRTGYFGLPVNPFANDQAAFQKSITRLDEICAFAAAVDCPRGMLVMPPSADTPKDELRKIALDRAQAMSEVLNRHKIRVGIEFLGPLYFRTRRKYEFMVTEPELIEFCKEAGPNWGLVLDTWHWYLSGSTIAEIESAGKDRIVTVHISDAKQMPPEDVRDNMRLFPGEGIIDLEGIFKALKKIGYEGGITPEVLGRAPDSWTPEEAAKAALDSTRAVLKKAGITA